MTQKACVPDKLYVLQHGIDKLYVLQHGVSCIFPSEIETFDQLLTDEEDVIECMQFYVEDRGYQKELYKKPHKVIMIDLIEGSAKDVTVDILKKIADDSFSSYKDPPVLLKGILDIHGIEYFEKDYEYVQEFPRD